MNEDVVQLFPIENGGMFQCHVSFQGCNTNRFETSILGGVLMGS